MQKFSKISGFSIPEKKPQAPNPAELDKMAVKAIIIKLMDNYLTIRSYGAPRQELFDANVKISGKEMFAEALLDLFDEASQKKKVEVLESLKSITRDWEMIDNKIDELISEEEVNPIQEKSIRNFLNTHTDSFDFENIAEKFCNRINSLEKLEEKLKAVKKIGKNYTNTKIQILKEKIALRIQKLSFESNGNNNS